MLSEQVVSKHYPQCSIPKALDTLDTLKKSQEIIYKKVQTVQTAEGVEGE